MSDEKDDQVNEEEDSEAGRTEEETTPEAEETEETPKPQPPSSELKVVIVMKDDSIMLGVQSPDCDPVYDTMKGTLAAALKKVPALVAKAKQQWEANPRYPKADLPEPPPPPASTRSASAESGQKKPQKSFF